MHTSAPVNAIPTDLPGTNINRYPIALRLYAYGQSFFALLLTAAAMLFCSATSAATLYVDTDALGAGSGANWADAYTDLQDALSSATSGDEIWVAEGSYKAGVNAADTFHLKNNVALYGGFTGIEASLEQRDHQTHKVILNGDLQNDDTYRYFNFHAGWNSLTPNTSHIVTADGVDASALLDGFVLSHGQGGAGGSGGGLYVINASPTIRNTTMEASQASPYGGGAYIGPGSAPTFTDSTFVGNLSITGGGVFISGLPNPSTATFTRCHFERNIAVGVSGYPNGGGAIKADIGATATVIASTFVNNRTSLRTAAEIYATSSSTWGGAISAASHLVVRDSVFISNFAHRGGAIYAHDGATLINNIFNGNKAPGLQEAQTVSGDGGAMLLFGSSVVSNNTITNNIAGESAGGIGTWLDASESIQITNTILWGNRITKPVDPGEDPRPAVKHQLTRIGDVSVEYGILEGLYEPIIGEDPVNPASFPGVLDTDPLFVSQTGADGTPGNEDDDLQLSAVSPAIDAGNNNGVENGVTIDILGGARFLDDLGTPDTGLGNAPIVDMGAYETSDTPATNIFPVAVASANVVSGEAPLDVQFSSAGSGDVDGVIVSYDWDFGDGGSSNVENPFYTYVSAGVFTASLTVTDDQAASHVDAITITVTTANQPPVAQLSSSWIPGMRAPATIDFDGSASLDDGAIVSYDWDFGDGATGTTDVLTHIYTNPGFYTVTLTVTDDEGATDSVSIVPRIMPGC